MQHKSQKIAATALLAAVWGSAYQATPAWGQRAQGLDISANTLNWQDAANNGYQFGWVESTHGSTTQAAFAFNITAAPTASFTYNGTVTHFLIGPYHFDRPDLQGSGMTPQQDANYFLSAAGAYMTPGHLLPVLDQEVAASGGLSFSVYAQQFSDAIYAAKGMRPLFYSNENFASTLSTSAAATMAGLWIARSGFTDGFAQVGNPDNLANPPYGGFGSYAAQPWSAWQYSFKGTALNTGGTQSTIDKSVAHGDLDYLLDFTVPALWTNAGSGSWNTGTNWNSTPSAPGSIENCNVQLTSAAAGSINITLSSGTQNIRSLESSYNLTISGTGNLAVAKTATLDSGSTNTVSGGSVSANVLSVSSGAILNQSAGVMSATNWVSLGSTFVGSIQNQGTINLSGGTINGELVNAGTLNVTGNATINGLNHQSTTAVTVAAGATLTAGGGVTLGPSTITLTPDIASPGVIVLSTDVTTTATSGTANISSSPGVGQSAGILSLANNFRTFNVNDGSATTDLQITAPIASGALIKTGNGTMLVTGANTYPGTTTINGGLLQFSSAAVFSTTAGITVNSGAVGLSTGTIDPTLLNKIFTSTGGLALSSGDSANNLDFTSSPLAAANTVGMSIGAIGNVVYTGTITPDPARGYRLGGGGTLTISGANKLTGSRNVTIANGGTVVLASSNNYTGTTSVTGGTLNISADNPLGTTSNPIVFDGGTLQYGASFSLSSLRGITLNSGGGTIDTNGFNVSITQAIGGNGALTKAGSGTLTLSGTNTYTGGTALSGGVLKVSNNAGLGDAAGPITFNGGTLQLGANFSIPATRAVAINSGATIDTNTFSTTLAGAISGTGMLIKSGTGTLTLSGNNNLTGGVKINTGALNVNSDSALGDPSGIVLLTGGMLQFAGNMTLDPNRQIVLTSGTLDTQSFNVTALGTISGAGGFSKAGSGVLTTSAFNSYTGTTTIAAGTLAIDSPAGEWITMAGVITGAGALRKVDAGGITLTATNTWTGGTQINGGWIMLNSSGAVPSNITVNAGGAVSYFGGVQDTTFLGKITASATPSVGGLALGSGETASTQVIDFTVAPLNAANVVGMSIGANGNQTFFGTITPDATRGYRLGGGGTLTISGANLITGTRNVTITNGGTVAFASSNNYTGTTSLAGGTLNIGADARLGTTTNPIVFDNGTLQYGASFILGATRAITLNAGGGTIDTNGFNVTVSQAMSGVGGFTKDGNGKLTLSSAQLYSGTTTVIGGTLSPSTVSVFPGTGTLNVAGGIFDIGTLNVTQAAVTLNAGTIAGTTGTLTGNAIVLLNGSASAKLAGAGGAIKNGTGTIILTGANTYTGGTTVNAGILNINADAALGAALGSPAVNLTFNGGTLQYAGAFTLSANRSFQLNAGGGTIDTNGNSVSISNLISGAGSFTKSGAGTLTMIGGNSYTGGTILSSGTLAVSNQASLGTAPVSPAINLTLDGGTLQFGAAMSLDPNRTVELASSGTVDSNGNDVTFAGSFAGSGTLTKNGNGAMILGGSNSSGGAITVNRGFLRVTGANQLGAAGVSTTENTAGSTFGGTVQMSGNVNYNLPLAIGGAGATGGSTTAPGSVGALDNLSGNNTWAGTVTLNGTQTSAGDALLNQIGSTAGTLWISGAIVEGTGSTWAKTGNGDVVLTGICPNLYTGLTRVFGGRLIIEKDGALGEGASPTGAAGNTFQLSGSASTIAFRAPGLSTGFSYNTAEWIHTEGTGGTTGQIDNLGGTNTFAGNIALGGTNVTGSVRSSIGVSADSLELTSGIYGRNSSGNGIPRLITKLGPGTLILSGDSSIAPTNTSNSLLANSTLTISAGAVTLKGTAGNTANLPGVTNWNLNPGTTLTLAKAGALGSSSLAISAATLSATASQNILSPTTLTAGGTIDSAFNVTYLGAITGTGPLTKNGGGSLLLANTNSYTGGTIVNGGVLSVNADSQLGATAGSVTLNGATLTATASFSSARNISVPTTGTVSTPAGPVTFSGSVSGAGTFTKSGAGNLTVGNALTSAISISQGTLAIAAGGGASGTSRTSSLTNSGLLDLNDHGLIVDYSSTSPVAAIRQMLKNGYGPGDWSGTTGITSSIAHADTNLRHTLAYSEATNLGITNFGGQTITGNAVVVKYTYFGDSNLDGKVDLDNDFSLFVDGYNKQLTNPASLNAGNLWVNGDYNFDGVIDLDNDFSIFVASYNAFLQNPVQLAEIQQSITSSPDLTAAQQQAMLSSVPEPASITLLAIAAGALAVRRRRPS